MQQPPAAFKPRPICEVSLVEGRYFEDYIPGAVFEYGEIRVDEAEIIEFARRFDPQDMHVDAEAARRGRFGGLIASGWHTGAMMMRLLADNFLPRGAEPGRSGRHEPEADEHHRAPERFLKAGIVSDVHCNHAGLLRALEILGDVDELICLGDSIYEYRFSNEVVRTLKERGAHTILGNHEEGFLGPQGVRARQPEWIERSLLQWLAERPKRLELSVGGKKLLLVHSTPWEPQGAYVYPHDSILSRFGEAEADFVLYGHTHHQLVRRVGKVLVINPGSAGEARDQGNGRQLSCTVLDTVSEQVVSTDYPEIRG